MQLTVKIEATELADAINNLSAAVVSILAARAESRAEKAAEAVVTKAKSKKNEPQPAEGEITGSDGSDQASATIPAPEAVLPYGTPPAPQSEAVTHDKAKALAALKAKKVGPAVVRGVIADTGCAQIADIDNQAVLVSLYANLEAL